MRLMLDRQQFNHKPTSYETGGIKNRLQDVDISLPQLAESLAKGCSVVPAQLSGLSDSSFVSQQLFMVDIDNEELHITIEEALAKCEAAGVEPCIIYESFSSSPDCLKFRLGFLAETIITDRSQRDDVVISLLSILSDGKDTYCDTRCMDASRLFYGTDKEVRWADTKFDVVECLKHKSDIGLSAKSFYDTNKVYNNNTYIGIIKRTALKDMSIKQLQDLMQQNPIKFPSYESMMEHLTTEVDLHQFLGVTGKTFCCPFHDDHHPSAGIFKTTRGQWFFNCFGCGIKGNIIRLAEIIFDCGRMEAINKLMEIYQLSYEDSLQVKMLRENIRIMRSDEFEYMAPNTYDMIDRYNMIEPIDMIYQIALENAHHFGSNEEMVFFFSQKYFIERLGKSTRTYASKKLALMAFLKLCTKVPDDQVPADLMKKAEEIRISKHLDKTIQFYKIPSYGGKLLQESNERAKLWKENNLTMMGMSREMLQRLDETIADEVYPKFAGKPINEGADKFQERVERIINKELTLNGYVTEKTILTKLKGNYNYNMTRLKRCLQESMDKYGYIKKRATNEIKSQLGIKAKGNPIIIVRDGDQNAMVSNM